MFEIFLLSLKLGQNGFGRPLNIILHADKAEQWLRELHMHGFRKNLSPLGLTQGYGTTARSWCRMTTKSHVMWLMSKFANSHDVLRHRVNPDQFLTNWVSSVEFPSPTLISKRKKFIFRSTLPRLCLFASLGGFILHRIHFFVCQMAVYGTRHQFDYPT